MLNRFKEFFRLNIAPHADTAGAHDGIRLASAALLVEIMVTDGQAVDKEESRIKTLLRTSFDLSSAESEELFELAQLEVAEATSLYQFTQLVNQHFSASQKLDLLKQLWLVALSDGVLDKYEESLIRKLADLLHIRHSQYILAKNLARKELTC